jgi:EmrB/QacA subfamily drug resistance transporter
MLQYTEIEKKAVLLTVSLTSFLTPFAGSSFNIALPSIGDEYALSAVAMTWASLAYLLASAMFLIPFGKIADMYGRKRVYTYGVTVFSIASALLALYPTRTLIILYRALQGIGGAMIFGTGIAILVSVYTAKERGMILGINAATVYVGLSVGPFVGGFLTETFGWRSIFIFNVLIGVVAVMTILVGLRNEWKDNQNTGFDLSGSVLYSLTLLATMYGVSNLPSLQAYPPILIGIGLFALFLWMEAKADNPVLDVRMFRENRAFTFSNIATLINFSATYAMTFLLSMHLQYLKGLDPQQAGLVMIAAPVVQAVLSPVAGRLSDRIEPFRLAAIGMALTAFSLLPFMFISETTTLTYIAASLGLMGVGLAFFSSPNTNAIMGSVDRAQYGVASSTIGTMRLTGQMLSMGIAMTVFVLNLGTAEIIPLLYPKLLTSIRTTFTIFFVICLPGIIASMIRTRVPTLNLENS